MIERNFDIPLVAGLALREKQIQQNYRPVIAVHKWFARRPGTLFRALLLSEFSERNLEDAYFSANDLQGLRIADPFMGGGGPLLEANRLGCDVTGFDINPMSYWIVKEELEHVDLAAYARAGEALRKNLCDDIGGLYTTRCGQCDRADVSVKYFLWVKTANCPGCNECIDLFPGYLIAQDRRHPRNVFYCPSCSQLSETDNRLHPGKCTHCAESLRIVGPATRGRCMCPSCETPVTFPAPCSGPPKHRLFAMEYFCPHCHPSHKGRFFKTPDSDDHERYTRAETRLLRMRCAFVPEDEILAGDETNRLHRWGYRQYKEMFNARQLLGLELSARIIARSKNIRVRNALATNLSDLLRYQNMLCRYDAMALKSLDIFSVHGFPVGLIQCESNLIGIVRNQVGSVGSGGWSNILDKFAKAKTYCDAPFEIRLNGKKKTVVPIHEEWIGNVRNGNGNANAREITLICGDATEAKLKRGSLDAVITDPPYFGNVQYAELMDFCYVWLRKLVAEFEQFQNVTTTRNAGELTGNLSMGRTLADFTDGLSKVFCKMADAIKPGRPLAFTFHHNNLEAYHSVAVAILDSGLVCSATLPCPAEMGASIHINGTGSSIVDSVFVCRSTGTVARRWISTKPEAVAAMVQSDLRDLSIVHRCTDGDTRCIASGHLTRLAVWHLRKGWEKRRSAEAKLTEVARWIERLGGVSSVAQHLNQAEPDTKASQGSLFPEARGKYGKRESLVSF